MMFALIPITTIRSAMSKLIKDSSYGEQRTLQDVLLIVTDDSQKQKIQKQGWGVDKVLV